ncbi:MAG TPA: TIGR00645 family protein [Stellaceae bacterium]|nr:TIGR00645 family protein [Stellaceae bacterium]
MAADAPDEVSVRAAPERWLEGVLFSSRWLMAPFYLGLVLALAAMLYVFVVELVTELSHITTLNPEGAILMGLSLIDLSLAGNLILIVVFSGYENFVSKIDIGGHEDRPAWMGTVDFSGLKLKLVASIVAISAISLLRSFMKIGEGAIDEVDLKWRVIIHLTFVTSGVLLALMDLLSSRSTKH